MISLLIWILLFYYRSCLLLTTLESPQIIISPSKPPLKVSVGDHLPLYCTAVKGFPIPSVQWYSEGAPVYPIPQTYQQIYLVPTDSPHTTVYTCVGTIHSQGEIVDEVRVNVTVIVESKIIVMLTIILC